MNEPNAPVRGTALLTKALDIVELVAESDNRLKFKDIAERTGHSKSTLYRILSALSARGMIDIDQRDQSYVLGPKFTELAGSINSSSDLIAVSAGPLKALADQHGESVNLSILIGTAQLTISRWQGRLAQPFSSPLGERKPLHATGLGKCLLSFLPEPEREALIGRLQLTAYTPKTITDADSLRADIAITRARGFALDDSEIIEGTVCVSAPIMSADNRPIASVSLTGPAHRLTEERRLELASVLQMTTRRIGQLLIPQHNNRPTALSLPGGGHVNVVDARGFSTRALGWSEAWGGLVWQDGPGGRLQAERDGEPVTLVTLRQIDCSALTAVEDVLFLSGRTLFRLTKGTASISELRPAPELEGASEMAVLPDGALAVLRAGALLRVTDSGETQELVNGLDEQAGLAVSRDAAQALVVRASDGRILRVTLPGSHGGASAAQVFDLPDQGKVTGLCFDRSGKIWTAYHHSWSLSLFDPETGRSQHVAVPMPNLQGLASGMTPHSVFAGSDRISLSQSLVDAAPASGGLVKVSL